MTEAQLQSIVMTAPEPVPLFDRTVRRQRRDPFTVAAQLRDEIEKARDHRGGEPWPTWGEGER